MNRNYNNIDLALRRARRRYYSLRLITGFLALLLTAGILFFVMTLLEGIFYLNTLIKSLFFVTFFVSVAFSFFYFVLRQAFFMLFPSYAVSDEYLARLIAEKLVGLDDKLINYIQLRNMSADNPFVRLGLLQKAEFLGKFDFEGAFSCKICYKIILFNLIFYFFVILAFSFKPDFFKSSAGRLIDYKTAYSPPPPFEFKLITDSLTTFEGNDFSLKFKILGDVLPQNVFLMIDGAKFLVNQDSAGYFSFDFRKVYTDITFRFYAQGFYSEFYTLKVFPLPKISSLLISYVPPAYTLLPADTLENVKNPTVPYGSVVFFRINTSNTDFVVFSHDTDSVGVKVDNDFVLYKFVAYKSTDFNISLSNGFISQNLTDFTLNVLPDKSPSVDFSYTTDSADISSLLIVYGAEDDYGISKVSFVIENRSSDLVENVDLPVTARYSIKGAFYLYLNDYGFKPGDILDFYIKVCDNCRPVRNCTKSSVLSYFYPDKATIENEMRTISQEASSDLATAKDLISEIKQEIEDFKIKMLTEEVSEWEKKNFVDNILQKQNIVDSLLEKSKKELDKKIKLSKNLSDYDKELIEKQQKINELMKEFMDDEIKKLLKQIAELEKKLSDKLLDSVMNNGSRNYEALENSVDRTLELLRRLAVEEDFRRSADLLDSLGNSQLKLSERERKFLKSDSLDILKDDMLRQIDSVKNSLNDAFKQNNMLQKPLNSPDFMKSADSIKSKINKFDKNSPVRKLRQQMNNTGKQSKKLASDIRSMLKKNSARMVSEDIASLIRLRNNVINLSFAYEDMNLRLKPVSPMSGVYEQIAHEAANHSAEFYMVIDSLMNLAKRIPEIKTPVIKNASDIKSRLKSLSNLYTALNKNDVILNQYFIMTASNNLALLLDELIDMLQNNSQGSGSGQGSMMQMAKDAQEQLKKQLQDYINQLQKQQQSDGDKAKQLSKLLRQQEMFDKRISDLQKSGGISPETAKKLNEIKKLNEQTKQDILNDRITRETLFRQNRIKTRLLDAENAQRKQSFEKKRESKEGKDIKHDVNKIEFLEEIKQNSHETINKQNIILNEFYRKKYEQYINRMEYN